jgi:signal transduction histidine kinase
LDNLLTNAAKFSDPKSAIEIGVDCAAASVRIAVANHGTGMAKEYRDRAFGPFTQEARESSLSICDRAGALATLAWALEIWRAPAGISVGRP